MDESYITEIMLADGHCCTQVILQLALESMGEENQQMLDACAVFCGGLKAGHNCGALIGAGMLLAMADKRMIGLTQLELLNWFESEYGSVDCIDIVGPGPEKRRWFCPALIRDCYLKALEIMDQYGLSLD